MIKKLLLLALTTGVASRLYSQYRAKQAASTPVLQQAPASQPEEIVVGASDTY